MIFIIKLYYFVCVLGVYGSEYQEYLNIFQLPFNFPMWTTLNLTHPSMANCRLRAQDNWYQEEHPDIVGNGTPANPLGPQSRHPRYYLKKQRVHGDKIQFLALLDPEAQSLPDNPYLHPYPRYRRQLLAVFCKEGTIEPIRSQDRVHQGIGEHTCKLEETLISACYQDLDVGPYTGYGQIFLHNHHFREPYNAQSQRPNTENAKGLMRRCYLFKMKLPRRFMMNVPDLLRPYLKMAYGLNFMFVSVQGLGLDDECQQDELSWAHYNINTLIGNDNLQIYIERQSNYEGMHQAWFFCRFML